MKYFFTVLLISLTCGLCGCRSADDDAMPHLLLIDCRTQKVYHLPEDKLPDNDPLVPCITLPADTPVEEVIEP